MTYCFFQIHTIDGEDIRREKGTYTREKNNLFLKNLVELGKDGNFGVKESVLEKLKVEEIKFSDIFAGPEPVFEVTKRAKSAGQNVNFVAKKKIEGKSHQVWSLFDYFDLFAYCCKLFIFHFCHLSFQCSGDLNTDHLNTEHFKSSDFNWFGIQMVSLRLCPMY